MNRPVANTREALHAARAAPVGISDESVKPSTQTVVTAHTKGRKGRAREALDALFPPFLAMLAVVVIWQFIAIFTNLVPPPSETLVEAWRLVATGEFFGDMADSLRRVLVAFTAGIVVSTGVGILMGTNRFWERFFEPIVVIGLTIPGLIWALIVIMLLGIGELTNYVAVFAATSPMLVVNIWGGVKSLDKELIDMAHVVGLDAFDKVFHVILPQLVPHLLAASRYGLGLAWKVVVVLELYGATSGVGYQINGDYQRFDLPGVLAWTLLFVIVMLILEKAVIGLIEKRVTAWQPRADVWRR